MGGRGEDEREALARELLTLYAGVSLAYVDVNGGVDHLGTNRDGLTAACEVTTVTDGALKSTYASVGSLSRDCPELKGSWLVSVETDSVRFKRIWRDIVPLLRRLEGRKLPEGFDAMLAGYTFPQDDLIDEIGGLQKIGVTAVSILPETEGIARIHLALSGGFVAAGSDSALGLLESELDAKPDNFRKLSEARVDETHLFVWMDNQTDGAVARPLMSAPDQQMGHFGLPTRAPELALEVDHLWVVHLGTGYGWWWARDFGWRAIDVREVLQGGSA